MRRTQQTRLLSLVLLLTAVACGDFSGPTGPDDNLTPGSDIPDAVNDARMIVTLTPGASPAAVAAEHGVDPERVYSHVLNGFVGSVPEAARLGLMRDARVRRVERDIVMEAVGSQSTPPWGLDRIDQRTAEYDGLYNYSYTGAGVTVYVVDTGIRASHHDFGGRAVLGFDAWGETGEDCHGHGTHVAGTIGGGSWGVAKDVSLVAVRVLDCRGSGTVSGVVAGLDWVIANASSPAVVNMSLGGGKSATLDEAVARVTQAGIPVAVAAGNSGKDACTTSPAGAPEAVTVGATDRQDSRTNWSNYGSCLDLFAPGNEIRSAYIDSDDATAVMSGTSMASPHVAGVMALALSESPGLSSDEVAAVLLDRATKDVVGTALSANDHLLFSGTSSGGAGDSGGTDSEPNAAPTADFEWTCDGLTCSFRDLSTDPDGVIQSWDWALGAGAFSRVQNPEHTYASAGSYVVTLNVIDDRGASASKAYTVSVGGGSDPTDPTEPGTPGEPDAGFQLTAAAGKQKGTHLLQLSWSGASTANVDVLVDGAVVADVPNTGSYDHATGNRGKISYLVQLCEPAGGACSNEVTVQY